MDKHACKLCFRRFSNGRALGGHMRSHVAGRAAVTAALPVYSASSTSSAEEEEEKKGSRLSYVLRENPRKSFRLVDPEFSSYSAALDAGSSIVQDRESETESPRPPAFICHRRRSKRPRRGPPPPAEPETEPASSVSDTTLEEDVAISLMMLSRDVWTKSGEAEHEWYNVEEVEYEQIAGGGSWRRNQPEALLPSSPPQGRRSKFQCETCKKVFRSYQALGGHRASHKKMKQSCYSSECAADANADHGSKAHECPVCSRVFGSGQALGGHKRSHVCSTSAAAAATFITIVSSPSPPPPSPMRGCSKYRDTMIDLNLPAPMDDDAAELSAVSDGRPFI